jgi:lysyl-tRNA synthetase class 2
MGPAPKETLADLLKTRDAMLRAIRQFFFDRAFVEVETAYLDRSAPTDPYIEPLRVFAEDSGPYYLHTSPEMGMKKVLASGLERIFQICKVFRVEEFEEVHSMEFTMLEWYSPGTYVEAMEETRELIRFVGMSLGGKARKYVDKPWRTLVLRQLFLDAIHIDPFPLPADALLSRMKERGFEGLSEEDTWEDLFFKLFIQEVEPRVNRQEKGPCFIKDWPATLTAMARKKDPYTVERFELYMKGLEIANGYSELLDAKEQRSRFAADQGKRRSLGKALLPLDEAFLEALPRVRGPKAGVSIGLDRLLMVLLGYETIDEVLPGCLKLREK